MNNQRKVILIRSIFQNRVGLFSGLMAVLSILIGIASLTLLPLLASAFSKQRTYIPTNMLDKLMLSFPWLVLIVGLIFTCAVFIGIYYSHRIAGPLNKLEYVLKERLKGNKVAPTHLRSKDHLKELAELINQLMRYEMTLEKENQNLVNRIEAIFKELDTRGIKLESMKKIKHHELDAEIIETFNRR